MEAKKKLHVIAYLCTTKDVAGMAHHSSKKPWTAYYEAANVLML